MTILWLALIADAAVPKPMVIACTPRELKRPALYQVQQDGKCPEDTQAMVGKDKKPMYCVNTYHRKGTQCKQVQVPTGPFQPRGEH